MQFTDNNLIADSPYLDLLPKTDISPIFIMGDHRSGTTLLYKTLVATGCFNFLKAYHVIKYDEILANRINNTEDRAIEELEKLFESLGIRDRTIDKVMVTTDLPEEYGFILNSVVGDSSSITAKNLTVFQQLCRKIQFLSERDKPLLFKNPWDYSQFIRVKEMIPTAKFIFIHRHPLDVINSKLKAVRTIYSARNPYLALIANWYRYIFDNSLRRYQYQLRYSKHFDLGLRRVTKNHVASTTYFLQNIESLSNRDYLCIRYEDLCRTPEAKISQILDFLALKPKVNLDYESLIEPRSVKLLPEIEKNRAQICQQLEAYLINCGY